ncbi:unnamed protein product, partial [Polarella glacialis]
VAFLLGRAPDASHPPARLKQLEALTPRSIINAGSTSRELHGMEALAGADIRDCSHMHKRDRVTDFVEVMMKQSHLIRK